MSGPGMFSLTPDARSTDSDDDGPSPAPTPIALGTTSTAQPGAGTSTAGVPADAGPTFIAATEALPLFGTAVNWRLITPLVAVTLTVSVTAVFAAPAAAN